MQLVPTNLIDGYKADHIHQYPNGTRVVFSNLTPRSTRRGDWSKEVVIAGVQQFVKRFLIDNWNKEFFDKKKDEVVKKFARRINNYLGPDNGVGTKHIEDLWELGYLPVKIMALPEGTVYQLRVPSLVIWNTHPDFFWLTNYLETILSTSVWGMCTSATTARLYKKLLIHYAKETVGNTDFVQFQAHDFSFRGMFGVEAAMMSGAAHLFSFVGTDTVPAIDFLEEYYNADSDKELVGCSVAATEHSVMCAGGEDNEVETFRRLIEDVYPKGIISIVSDTWNFWNVICNTSVTLKDSILKRNGKVVFRPDTGDPVKIVCGYRVKEIDDVFIKSQANIFNDIYVAVADAAAEGYNAIKLKSNGKTYENLGGNLGKELSEAEIKGAIECLWEVFGGTYTPKGFKLLDSHVGLIYGDSITLERAERICEGLKAKGFASTNIVFGIGSYTYAYVTRDTDGYAVKATWVNVNDEEREIFKDPKTGDGTKKSACGLVAVYKNPDNTFYYKDKATWAEVLSCEYAPIFENGTLQIDYSLQQIRNTIDSYL